MRRLALALCCALGALAAAGTAPAGAETVWDLEMHHNQTNFSATLPGKIEASTLTQGSATESEVQKVTLTAESGSFTLSFAGQSTGGTGEGETSSGSKVITGVTTTSGAFVVGEAISGTNIPPDALISNVNPGAETISFIAASGATATGPVSNLSGGLVHDGPNAGIRNALSALPSIGAGNVATQRAVNGSATTYTVTFQGALANTDVPQILAAEGSPPLALVAHPQYWFDLANVGSSASSGPIELSVELPPGITGKKVIVGEEQVSGPPLEWSEPCLGESGGSTVVCTTEGGSIPRHRLAYLILEVDVEPGLPEGTLTATATLSGGGAADPAADSEPTPIDYAPVPFGILAPSFVPDFLSSDGVHPQAPERRAGSHPDLLTVPVDFNSVLTPTKEKPNLNREADSLRDLSVDLPAGFIGNPTAVGECTAAQYTAGACPPSSQVGRFDGTVYPLGLGLAWNFSAGVFNMVHPRGAITDIGFQVAQNPVHVKASLDPAHDYAITTKLADVNETAPPFSGKVTIWGIPADPSHDSERCGSFANAGGGTVSTASECHAEHPVKPFLTMPFRCDTDDTFALREYDSWQQSGLPNANPEVDYTIPGRLHGCDQVPFEPSVSVAPTTEAADSPSGLDVKIDLPQHEECKQIEPAPPAGETQYECETATSPLKDATVSLPAGIAVNPAAANGLEACTEAQIALHTDDPVRCPGASKVAEGQVITPALPDPVAASIYLATPHQNPFGSLLAGYLVLEEPDRGLLVKLPGKIAIDEATGQLTGTFKENPQLPFSELELHFKAGAHSTLITPSACGTYTAQADFSPWSGTADVHPSSSFTIRRAPGGGCPSPPPNSPSLDAGTVQPLAAHYSPFTLDLSREDGSQRFGSVTVSPPPGFTAKLAGTAECSEAALAAAAAKSGKEEQASPSCPAASKIGEVWAAAGAGPDPYWAPGTAYLTGPYKGAPLSMAIITPAVAGPFDLGTVVVRSALRVDPETARITAVSDPLPTSLQGIPLDIRRARVFLDRPDFTLNGTNCDPLSFEGALTSTIGQSAPLMQRFQLGECSRLAFKPKMTLRLKGGTRRAKNPKLIATVYSQGIGVANLHSVSVRLPRSAFLDQSHIRTICTRVQWAADACPKGSIYGKAWVKTPLVDYWLAGNVYLRSSNHKLPDLIIDLRGPESQPLRFDLDGRTDSVKGALRNRFEAVPDQPFQKARVVLFGGKRGLIVNSRDLCAHKYRATVDVGAQNGAAKRLRPLVKNSCGKAHKRRHGGHHRRGGGKGTKKHGGGGEAPRRRRGRGDARRAGAGLPDRRPGGA